MEGIFIDERNALTAPEGHRRKRVFMGTYGALAQLVEQWTENPRVPGSIPGGATMNLSNR